MSPHSGSFEKKPLLKTRWGKWEMIQKYINQPLELSTGMHSNFIGPGTALHCGCLRTSFSPQEMNVFEISDMPDNPACDSFRMHSNGNFQWLVDVFLYLSEDWLIVSLWLAFFRKTAVRTHVSPWVWVFSRSVITRRRRFFNDCWCFLMFFLITLWWFSRRLWC